MSEHHDVKDHQDKGEHGKDVSPQVLVSGDNSGVLTIWSLDEQDGEGALVPQVSKSTLKVGESTFTLVANEQDLVLHDSALMWFRWFRC